MLPARLRLVLVGLTACALAAVVGVFVADAQRQDGPAVVHGPSGFAGSVRPPGLPVPDMGLRDQDGRAVHMRDYAGQPVVVTFVYSTCRDTCPAQVQTIRGALDDLGHAVPVLAVSVDPVNDTPANAKRFLAAQHMIGRARFVLGTRAQLAPIWRAYGIRPQQGKLDHTAFTVLVDREQRQRVGWPFERMTDDGLRADLATLLSAR